MPGPSDHYHVCPSCEVEDGCDNMLCYDVAGDSLDHNGYVWMLNICGWCVEDQTEQQQRDYARQDAIDRAAKRNAT